MVTRRMVSIVITSLATTGLAGCGASERISGVGPGVEEERREIVTTYDDALDSRNDATETRDTGVNLFNTAEYSESVKRLESARSGYGDAEAGFAEAAELATALAEAEAASICKRARDKTRLEAEATEAALAAVTAAEAGADASAINEHIREFRDIEAEASALTVEDTDVLVAALGLQ